MKQWTHPMEFTGTYPSKWNGYTFLQWSWASKNWHEGVDYNYGFGSQDLGRPIYAASEGVVEWFGYHNGWGNHIFIRHKHPKYGTIYSHYAHLLNMTVKVGQKVKIGEMIGTCGKSGWKKMSPHLHFEIRKPIGQGYGFYPQVLKGWTQKKTKQFYTDPYKFIESNGNGEW